MIASPRSTFLALMATSAYLLLPPATVVRHSITVPASNQEPGRTYYVSKEGDDKSEGTSEAPFQTIRKAAQLARAGDTILLKPGVYRERVILRQSGEQDRPITLKGEPGNRPVIEPADRGEKPPGQAILLQSHEGYTKPIGWITIEGIEARHGNDGVKLYNAHDIVIRDCVIKDNWGQGILGTGSRVLVDRCEISGNGLGKGGRENLLHGVYATGTAWTISNCIIHSNSAYGIQVAGKEYDEKSMADPEYARAKDWVISNNTIALNKLSSGIVLWQKGVENCLVQNNIFFNNGTITGITFYAQQDHRHVVRNNIFFPVGKHMKTKETGCFEEMDNIHLDPLFVDVKAFDFHLQQGSPAVDAGSSTRAPKVDYAGKARPQGERVDIGALESVR